MSRFSTVSLCAATLVVGIVLGAHGEWWRVGTRVQADPPEASAADRGYRELQAGHSALVDSSELLAKISRLTTNSVVHIQSERRSKRGSLIEETGSGVIMESTKARGFFVVTNRHVV